MWLVAGEFFYIQVTEMIISISGNESQVYFSFCWIGVIAIVADSRPDNDENVVPFQTGLLSLFHHIIVQCIAGDNCASLCVAQCSLVIKWHCLHFH